MAGAPTRYEVLLTQSAEQDLESIHGDIAEFDSAASANRVLDRLLEIVDGFAQFPERGSHPKELIALGIKDYHQVFFKPYLAIYRVTGERYSSIQSSMVAGTCNRCWPGGCSGLEARPSWSGCIARFAPRATAGALAGLTRPAGRTRLVEKLEGVRREYLVGSGRKSSVQRISGGMSG